MKKFLVMAAAAGALAVGGAASAQDIGSVLGSIFGFGTPQYPYGAGTPAVVAGTVPHGSQVYIDQYGRQVYIDQWGRHVLVQPQQGSNYGIIGYDQWGRPVYGTISSGVYGYSNHASVIADRDRDGVADRFDRYPHDWRYR